MKVFRMFSKKKLASSDNFDVSILKVLTTKITLKNKAFESSNAKNTLDHVNDLNYTEKDFKIISDKLVGILENVSNDREVYRYIHTTNNDIYAIKGGIKKLCRLLNDTQKEHRCYEFKPILKGYCLIADVLENSNISPLTKFLNLELMAEASNFCSSAWKENLEKLFLNLESEIVKVHPEFNNDLNKEPLIRSIDNIFCQARESVATEIINKFIKDALNYHDDPLRPHFEAICRNRLNKSYNFNIVNANLRDAIIPFSSRLSIDLMFKFYLKNELNKSIDDIIYNKVCEIFYEQVANNITDNGNMFEMLVDWSREYLNKNELDKNYDGAADFMYNCIMDPSDEAKIRYIAINEILKDCGYIKEKQKKISYTEKISYFYEDKKRYAISSRLNRAIGDIRSEKEYQQIYQDIQKLADKDIILALNVTPQSIKLLRHYDNNTIKFLFDGRDVTDILHYECRKGHNDTVALLLDSNLDFKINRVDSRLYSSILMVAIKNNINKELIQKILDLGANVNRTNGKDMTPLLFAAKYRDVDVVNMLLEHNADINKSNINGDTALILAARYNNSDVVKLLLEKNADIDKTNNKGQTADDIAKDLLKVDTTEVLDEYRKTHKKEQPKELDPVKLHQEYMIKSFDHLCKINAARNNLHIQ